MEESKNRFALERKRFPVTQEFVYLDNASRGPLSPPAREIIDRELKELLFLHPSQLKEMRAKFSKARDEIAGLVKAPSETIGFVSSTSDGIAMAAGSLPINEGDNIICAHGEFPANVYPWLNLRNRGVEIRLLERRLEGTTPDQVREAMDRRTRAVALSWVGFSNGARIDTGAIGALCRERNAFFVLDAIQGVGALEIDLRDIDIAVCGTAKWTLAPQGGGFVYIAPHLIEKLQPDRIGWLSVVPNADLKDLTALTDYQLELAGDARRIEIGSNSPLTHLALGASCGYLSDLGPAAIESRIINLCDYLVEGLKSRGIQITTPLVQGRRSGIVCFAVPDLSITHSRLLDRKVVVSSREGQIRAGIHFYNNEEDLDRLLDALE